MTCAFFVKSVGVATKFGKLANSNSFLSVEIRLRHVRRVRNRPRPGLSLYRKLNTWKCPEKGFAAEMNAQTGEVLFILVCFPVYRWSGMLAKCQEVAWSGPRRIWAARGSHVKIYQFCDGAREVPCGARVSGNLAKRAKKFKISVLRECP